MGCASQKKSYWITKHMIWNKVDIKYWEWKLMNDIVITLKMISCLNNSLVVNEQFLLWNDQ